jgi:hypothetical protein
MAEAMAGIVPVAAYPASARRLPFNKECIFRRYKEFDI